MSVHGAGTILVINASRAGRKGSLFFLFTNLTEAIAAEFRRIASLWRDSGRFREREARRKFDPQNRDKNIDYYIAKLDELVKKFGGLSVPTATQEMLAL